MEEEHWQIIPDFPNYQISNLGRIYNSKFDHIMKTSINNYGHVKITLKSDRSNERLTRSVAWMVAEAFVEAPNKVCDHVIILNGEFSDTRAVNLAWRPRWYSWKYTRQLKLRQPVYFNNLTVHNLVNDLYYESVIEAGIVEGLLFEDVWRSTYTKDALFPYGHVFEIVERV